MGKIKMATNKKRQIKNFMLTLVLATCVMVVVVSLINVSRQNIAGGAFYNPVQVYGTVYPSLPDGTDISFRVGRIELASTTLKDNSYDVSFTMDNPLTAQIEGYAEGDVVSVYIEEIRVVEFSYFEVWGTQKIINIPGSKRIEIANRAAIAEIQRECDTNWNCGEWGDCINGVQTRNCIDYMGCGTDVGKPVEKRTCVVEPAIEQPGIEEKIETSGNIITASIFVLIVVALIISITRKIASKKK